METNGKQVVQLRTRINEAHIHGEKGTGYTDEEAECSECEYFVPKNSGCRGEAMKAKSRRPRNADGTVQVAATGHCVYFEQGTPQGWRKAATRG